MTGGKKYSSSVTVHAQLGHFELFKYGTLSEIPHEENPPPTPLPYGR